MTQYTWEMVCKVAEDKGWSIETKGWSPEDRNTRNEWGAVRRLERNYKLFRGRGLGLKEQNDEARRKKRAAEKEANKKALSKKDGKVKESAASLQKRREQYVSTTSSAPVTSLPIDL